MERFLVIVGILFLAGCRGQSLTLDHWMENPLFAERYAEELVEHMVQLAIQKDPVLEDSRKSVLADEARRSWLERAQKARKLQREGTVGQFIPTTAYTAGETLYLDRSLYLGTTFETTPSLSLHLYLTTVVDPREVEFPDPTARDLGKLQSAYGAQTYTVPKVSDSRLYRTVVLWDTELERIIGFAQLNSP